jgi:hypothetical protein
MLSSLCTLALLRVGAAATVTFANRGSGRLTVSELAPCLQQAAFFDAETWRTIPH